MSKGIDRVYFTLNLVQKQSENEAKVICKYFVSNLFLLHKCFNICEFFCYSHFVVALELSAPVVIP